MPLFETLSIDKEKVKELVKRHWDLELFDCLKSSQNHTFLVKRSEGADEKFILRVTPDPKRVRIHPTELELTLVDFVFSKGLPVCQPIRTLDSNQLYVVSDDNCILSVSRYADGVPVVYTEWTWMTNRDIVVGLGRWFGQLHSLVPAFIETYPELAKSARHWTELHDGVLKGVPVDPNDEKDESDPKKFTIIHGDVNPSNYFWSAEKSMPVMFDWDQTQKSWKLYDLSAPIWGVYSLERHGSPIDGSKVPESNTEQYTNWILEGYESITKTPTDRDQLHRMCLIRRQLYLRFCKRALDELPKEHPMYSFCLKVTQNFEKEDQEEKLLSK